MGQFQQGQSQNLSLAPVNGRASAPRAAKGNLPGRIRNRVVFGHDMAQIQPLYQRFELGEVFGIRLDGENLPVIPGQL